MLFYLTVTKESKNEVRKKLDYEEASQTEVEGWLGEVNISITCRERKAEFCLENGILDSLARTYPLYPFFCMF